MKKFIIGLFCCLLFTTCSKSNTNTNCNFLLNAGVNFSINLNLPQYSNLQFTSNSAYVANQGNGGVIVTNVGSGLRAWDASDPNHAPTSCSILEINSANAICGCTDENTYSLFTGQSINDPLPCGLREYRVEQTGENTYFISN